LNSISHFVIGIDITIINPKFGWKGDVDTNSWRRGTVGFFR